MISFATGPLARIGYVVKHAPRRPPGARRRASTCAARQVSIAGEEFWCSADGEIYGPERHRTWTVEPAAFHMVLPHHGNEVTQD